jgi:hypothetical protein
MELLRIVWDEGVFFTGSLCMVLLVVCVIPAALRSVFIKILAVVGERREARQTANDLIEEVAWLPGSADDIVLTPRFPQKKDC